MPTVGDQKYYTGLLRATDSTTGVNKPSTKEPVEQPPPGDLVADSCIDWGALSPREVAAAFVMLKGGRRAEAEALLTEVLAEVQGMSDALAADEVEASATFFQGNGKGDASKAKYYSGM